jgi:hypothetical protein
MPKSPRTFTGPELPQSFVVLTSSNEEKKETTTSEMEQMLTTMKSVEVAETDPPLDPADPE